MAIAYQPVTTPDHVRARPAPWSIRYATITVDRPSRAWTAIRLLGLLAGTALCVALAVAVVVGTALFALLNAAG